MEGEGSYTIDTEFKFTRNNIILGMLELLREDNEDIKSPGARGDMISLMRPIMISISVRLKRSEKAIRKEVLYDAESAALIIFEIRRALREYKGTELRSRIVARYPIMINDSFWNNLAEKLDIVKEYGTFSLEI